MRNVAEVCDRVARALMSGYRMIEPYDESKSYDVWVRHGIWRSPADERYHAGPEVFDSVERATKLFSGVFVDYPIDSLAKKVQDVLLGVKDHAAPLQNAQERLASGIQQLASELSALGDWEVVGAVTGIDMSEGSFAVGQCQVFQMDEVTFQLWGKRYATGLYNPPETAPILANWYHDEQALIDQSVASIRIKAADSDHARWLAKVRLEESLNLLRYAQAATVGFDWPFPEIGLHVGRSHSHELSIRLDDRDFSTSKTLGGPIGTRFSLNNRAPGWAELDTILKKDRLGRSEMEDRLVRCLEWFGNAALAKADTVRLVSLATALEALLILRGESRGKKKKLRERTAWILGTTRQERDALDTDVDRFYSRRSECVHGGETQVERENLEKYTSLVTRCLGAIVVNRSFRSAKSLQGIVDWVDAKMAQQSP